MNCYVGYPALQGDFLFCLESDCLLRIRRRRRKLLRWCLCCKLHYLSKTLAMWLAYQREIKQRLSVLKRSGMPKKRSVCCVSFKQCEGCIGALERDELKHAGISRCHAFSLLNEQEAILSSESAWWAWRFCVSVCVFTAAVEVGADRPTDGRNTQSAWLRL